jgi:isoleucyl-tRNA synthetase
MINTKDQYILYNEDDYSKLNPTLMIKFLKTFFIINSPIIPHFTEYMYLTYLNPLFEKCGLSEKTIKFLSNSRFPNVSSEIDIKLFEYNKYLNRVIQGIREVASKSYEKKKKIEKNDNNDIKIKVLYAKEYSLLQKEVLNLLGKENYNEKNKIISLDEKGNPKFKTEILSDNKLDKNAKRNMLEFAAYKIKEVEAIGLEALNETLKFKEEEVLTQNAELFKKLARLKDIDFLEYNEKDKPKNSKESAIPGKPLFIRVN